MLTRRRFGQTVGAGALALGAGPAFAKPATMRFANAAGVVDAQLSFISVGAHPKLHYHQDEGIEVDVINVSSVSQSLQALATGQCEFASMTPTAYLPLMSKNPT